MASPPTFTVPPPPPKKSAAKPSRDQQLYNMLKRYGPRWLQYMPSIMQYADAYHIDRLYLASVLLQENAPADQNPPNAGAGAVGPTQIKDTVVDSKLNQTPWDGPSSLSVAWRSQFANAIHYTAWRLQGALQHYAGSLDQAYAGTDPDLRGYNPGFSGPGPTRFLPPGYIPKQTATPAQTAPVSVAGTKARAELSDPWAVIKKNGKVGWQAGTEPPNAIKLFKLPMTRSSFLQWFQHYSDIYQSYTGDTPSFEQVAHVLKMGYSDTALSTALANSPKFVKSPVYKQHEPAYQAIATQIYGPGFKLDQKTIAQAVVNNYDGTTFAAALRQRPDYVKSEEFKQARASMTSVYQSIYGPAAPQGEEEMQIEAAAKQGWSADQFAQYLRKRPNYVQSNEFKQNATALQGVYESIYGVANDAAWKAINQATIQGWNQAQFASYLRAQPGYTRSPEYLSRALSLAQALGLITGRQPTLQAGQLDTALNLNTTNTQNIPNLNMPTGQPVVNPTFTDLGVVS